jgi:hypothetical protein
MQRLRAPNNQKLYAKRARAVTSFKAARVYASMSLRPIGITKVGAQLRDAHCEGTSGTRLKNNIVSKYDHREGSDPPSNSRHHPKRQNLHPDRYSRHDGIACKCMQKKIKKEDLNVYCNILWEISCDIFVCIGALWAEV